MCSFLFVYYFLTCRFGVYFIQLLAIYPLYFFTACSIINENMGIGDR